MFVTIVFLVSLGYVSLLGLPWKKDEEVKEFITQQNKSDVPQKDFLSVKGVYSFKGGSYGVIVVYKDEPEVMYSYEKGSDDLFYQTGASAVGKHWESK